MRGPGASQTSGSQQNYTNSLTGKRFGVAAVDVQTSTLSGPLPGRYSFNVSAPLNVRNQLKLNKATSVNIIEGTIKDVWASLSFGVNTTDHDSVAFHGIYAGPGMVHGSAGDPLLLDAYTDPTQLNMAHLTPERLMKAVNKATLIIRAAKAHHPTGQAGRMEPPFVMPTGAVTGIGMR